MGQEQNRQLIERFWATMGTNDFRAVGDLLHDDFVLDYPQSGERFRGREHWIAINANYPAHGRWHFVVHRIVADEHAVVTDVTVTDGVVVARSILFSEVRDGLIARQTEYWPDPFAAPAWRAQWVARTD